MSHYVDRSSVNRILERWNTPLTPKPEIDKRVLLVSRVQKSDLSSHGFHPLHLIYSFGEEYVFELGFGNGAGTKFHRSKVSKDVLNHFQNGRALDFSWKVLPQPVNLPSNRWIYANFQGVIYEATYSNPFSEGNPKPILFSGRRFSILD